MAALTITETRPAAVDHGAMGSPLDPPLESVTELPAVREGYCRNPLCLLAGDHHGDCIERREARLGE